MLLSAGLLLGWIAGEPASPRADPAKELARLAKLAPAAHCAGLDALLDTRDLDEESRRAALSRIRDLARDAAPPLNEAESAEVEALTKRSSAVVEPLLSRYTIVLGSANHVAQAKAGLVPGLLDATYVVQRQLFGLDPVKEVGRRYVFFPEKTKPWGWTIHPASLTVAYGQSTAEQGTWADDMAHELSHGFTARHPAKHLFAGGFGEGWSDLAAAYTGERLAFLGGPLEKTWAQWRDGIVAAGEAEYVRTRMPVEEIVAYGPSVSVVLRLVLDTPAAPGRTWDPLVKLFHEGVASPPPALPGFLWPARVARDLQRVFPAETTWDVLSRWRFPIDAGSQKELDLWTQRARTKPPAPRAETWKADGQTPLVAWRVAGPLAAPEGRGASVDFDPLDAWNFDGAAPHPWRTDVAVDADGIVQLGALEGSAAPCVFYLRADLPPEAEGPVTLWIASDDDCAVWVDGVLVHAFRGERGTWPDDPDRAYAKVAKGGGRVLAQVANRGGPAGFHLRWSKGTPFETSLRVDARAPDLRRRLMAVRRFGSMRVPFELVAPLYDSALGDGSPLVRAEAARLLGGRRSEPRAVEELLATWTREKDTGVSVALRGALSELALADLADSAIAHRWWRDEGKSWREADHVEAELAYVLGSIRGGFYGNHAGSIGNQHVGRCFGGDPTHGLNLVLEAHKPGAYVLAVRFASADGERKADIRVRRGEQTVAGRFGVVFQRTSTWESWTWLAVPLGVLPAGRLRIEISNVDGCLDLDVLGLRPAKP